MQHFAFAMLCCVVMKSSWAFTTVPKLMQSSWAFTTVPLPCRQREKKRCHSARVLLCSLHSDMEDPRRLGDKKNQNLEWAAGASAAELEQLRSELWNSEIEADWNTFYRTVKTEQSYFASEIEGEIPVDLQGSIFRNGPGRFDRGGKRYEHVLDGDGHILKFVLDGSSQRAHISNKYVRTAEFVAEEARDAVLFRSTFGTQPQSFKDNFLNLKLKNQANTNVQFCGGRLLALWEAGVPYRLNPWTLATEGPDTLDGCVSGPLGALTVTTGVAAFDKLLPVGRAFTAHPHYDSATRRTVGWSWAQNPLGNFLDITLVEWAGDASQPVCESTYRMEGCTMAPHDFAVTGSYYIFVVNQLDIQLAPYVLGLKGPAQSLRCTGDGVAVHLVPRPDGPAAATPPRVLKTSDAWFVIHHAFAHDVWRNDADAPEEEGEGGGGGGGGGAVAPSGVVVYSTGWDEVSEGPFLADWGGRVPLYDKIPATFLFKVSIDLASGRVAREKLSGHCEHAHVHPEWEASRGCRYVFVCAGNRAGISSPPVAWLRYDLMTGEEQMWCAPPRQFVEELVIIPKKRGSSTGTGEKDTADAWLAGMIYCADRDQSCLAILDAANIEAGPVCRIWCEGPSPNGLHGCYAPQLYFPPSSVS